MKVCLISPPTVTEFSERHVAESEALRLIAEHAPMGILSLAAVLEARGVTPHIIDLNRLYYEYVNGGVRGREGLSFAAFVIPRLAGPFDVFGFSTICSTYPLTLRIAEGVRLRCPEAKIILGGPQASVVDVPTLAAFPFVDYVVRGEAEASLPRLLEALASNQEGVAHINGITYRKGQEVMRNPNAPVIEDLDSLPMPAFHLYPYIKDSDYAALEAGRGCPFACSFCSTNDFFRRRFRMKSPRALVEQMVFIKARYGIDYFDLIHDMFTVDRKKVLSFCDAVEESGEKLLWGCSARTDCLDEEMLSRMARAGCFGLFIGVDSGSERIQGVINKRLDISEALTRVKQSCRHGIKTTVSLITGFPDETKDDLRQTMAFLGESMSHRHADLQLHLLAPLAETPITTQYQDDLIYDDIFSDMSFQGWEQDPQDRSMIIAHRDIFTNFYAVPTRHLNRRYLKDLKEFFHKGMLRHRWLMVLLHRDAGDLLRVFDEWQNWSPAGPDPAALPKARTRAYYRSPSFSRDLLCFARSRYVKEISRHPHLVSTLVKVESAFSSFSESASTALNEGPRRKATKKRGPVGVDAVPVMVDDMKVIDVEADYKRLMICLQRKTSLDRICAEPLTLVLLRTRTETKIMQLNDVTSQLLRSCDGSRSMMEVANGFSDAETLAGVSAAKVGLYGLAVLARQGLIELREAAS